MLVGVVGKANVGKSTFFKAATLAEVEIANYPFVTIKANEGVGFVKVKCADKEFNVKCQAKHGYCLDGARFVPVQLLDVAGLVPGAHKGVGMGNAFLDDLRQADVLIHVLDVSGSTNEKGEPVDAGSYDPAEDIKFLENELDMWYFGLIKKGWDELAKKAKQDNEELTKALGRHLTGLSVNEKVVEKSVGELGLPSSISEWNDDSLKTLAVSLRKLTKPMIIACNKIDVASGSANFSKLKKEFPDHMLVGCSAESELALREAAKHKLIDYVPGSDDFNVLDEGKLSDKQQKALGFIKENVLKKFGGTGVQTVLDDSVFNLLKYIPVYPVTNSQLKDKDGNVLPDCFLVPDGITALDFAFKVHTDIGENFIRAIDLKTKMTVGKEHKLKSGDVVEIVADK